MSQVHNVTHVPVHSRLPVTEDVVIAAVLHDAAEDHGGLPMLKAIESNFGSEAARMVAGLSDSLVENADEREPWPERKRAYPLKLRDEPADVRLISVADKLYNARAILEDYREVRSLIWNRFQRGRNEQLWYFDELLEVYKGFPVIRIVAEYGRVIAELRRVSAGEK